MDALKTNNIKIVGRLGAVDLKTANRKNNGAGYISGNITINSVIGGEDKEYEVSLFANEMTKEGKPSQLYQNYAKLSDLVGRKIEVTGELREDRYFSSQAKQLISSQKLSGRFVKGVTEVTPDEATFEIGGFIVSGLTEKKNKDGEIYRYDVQLGQGNYNYSSLSIFNFNIKPTEVEIVKGISNSYKVGDTVVLNGNLDFVVKTVTKESANVGFGSGAVRTYTNRIRSFWICGGSVPIASIEDGAYPRDLINSLISAYKAHDVELSNKAADSATANDSLEDKPAVSNRQASLI